MESYTDVGQDLAGLTRLYEDDENSSTQTQKVAQQTSSLRPNPSPSDFQIITSCSHLYSSSNKIHYFNTPKPPVSMTFTDVPGVWEEEEEIKQKDQNEDLSFTFKPTTIMQMQRDIDILKSQMKQEIDRLKSQLQHEKICFIDELKDRRALNMSPQWMYCSVGNCNESKKEHKCEFVPCSSFLAQKLDVWVRYSTKEKKLTVPTKGYEYHMDDKANIWQENIVTHMQRRIISQIPQKDITHWLASMKVWDCLLAPVPPILNFNLYKMQCEITETFTKNNIPLQQMTWNYKPNNFKVFNAYCSETIQRDCCRLLVLYHGISHADPTSIRKHGVLLHYSKEGVYSRGLYFAENPYVCYHSYTSGVSRTILVCLVNVGISFVQKDNSWKSDQLCVRNGELQDSIKFTFGGSTCYVVPRSEQVLILATITC
jgi:hypothetical protein